MRKIIRNLLIGVLLVLTVIGIAACVPSESGEPNGPDGTEKIEYTVTVTTVTGDPQPGVSVQFSDEESVLASQFTNSEGSVTVSLPAGEYKVELVNLPEGYMMDNVYTTDTVGTPIEIMVVTGVISGEAPEGHVYTVGSMMYDFTYTEVETGEEKSLSELLETKKAVLLNFWYTTCYWCNVEFPLMQEAYEQYQDDLAIVAINPGMDDAAACRAYKQMNDLTFDFTIDAVMTQRFAVTGYPTNVMIDRYGVVREIEAGGITDIGIFLELFEQYTKDNYTPPEAGSDYDMPDVEAPARPLLAEGVARVHAIEVGAVPNAVLRVDERIVDVHHQPDLEVQVRPRKGEIGRVAHDPERRPRGHAAPRAEALREGPQVRVERVGHAEARHGVRQHRVIAVERGVARLAVHIGHGALGGGAHHVRGGLVAPPRLGGGDVDALMEARRAVGEPAHVAEHSAFGAACARVHEDPLAHGAIQDRLARRRRREDDALPPRRPPSGAAQRRAAQECQECPPPCHLP